MREDPKKGKKRKPGEKRRKRAAVRRHRVTPSKNRQLAALGERAPESPIAWGARLAEGIRSDDEGVPWGYAEEDEEQPSPEEVENIRWRAKCVSFVDKVCIELARTVELGDWAETEKQNLRRMYPKPLRNRAFWSLRFTDAYNVKLCICGKLLDTSRFGECPRCQAKRQIEQLKEESSQLYGKPREYARSPNCHEILGTDAVKHGAPNGENNRVRCEGSED